ncbi:hypothetical protein CK203_109005 [Vitis vinifera]|uniref:Reverse transcriptase domain-containing protein n=1 Tax=Vitis vinifera TaxID=29760 RepID=A0A438EM98_VITVI|nr:hypothetical protein CK203_109005 [Vitis vinifera]
MHNLHKVFALPSVDSEALEIPFSEEEVLAALSSLSGDKAPGLKINLEKSELIPVGNVFNMEKLARTLGCKEGTIPTTYLSLPLGALHKSHRIDKWCGDTPLRESFPAIYSIVSLKYAWVVAEALVWLGSKNGNFSIKSFYSSLASGRQESFPHAQKEGLEDP